MITIHTCRRYAAAHHGLRVVTFEALPHNVDFIDRHLKRFDLQKHVTLVHGAVWDTAGETKYFADQVLWLCWLSFIA